MERIESTTAVQLTAPDTSGQGSASNVRQAMNSPTRQGAEHLGRELVNIDPRSVIAATGPSTSVVSARRDNSFIDSEDKDQADTEAESTDNDDEYTDEYGAAWDEVATLDERLTDLFVDNPELAEQELMRRAELEAAKNAELQASYLEKTLETALLDEQIKNWHTTLRNQPNAAQRITLSNEHGDVDVSGCYRPNWAHGVWSFQLTFKTMNTGERTLETMHRVHLFEIAERGAKLNLVLEFTSLPADLLAGEEAADDSPQWTLPAAIQQNFNILVLHLPLPYQLDIEPTEHSALKSLVIQRTALAPFNFSSDSTCKTTLKIPAGVEVLDFSVSLNCPPRIRFMAPEHYPDSLQTLSLNLMGVSNPTLVNLQNLPSSVQNLTLILHKVSATVRNDALCAALGRAGNYLVEILEPVDGLVSSDRCARKTYSSGIDRQFDWPNKIKTKGMIEVSIMCSTHSLPPVMVKSWPWVREALEAHQAQASSQSPV